MKNTNSSKSAASVAGAAMYPSSLVDKVASSAHSTVDRMADAAPAVIDQFASGVHTTVDRAAKSLQPAAKRIGGLAQKLNRTGNTVVTGTKQYVTEHPVLTIVSAVAFGMLVSSLMRDRD